MEFEEDELSGNLIASGTRGDYLLFECVWTTVELAIPDAAGLNTEPLGAFSSLDDAKQFCNTFDNMTDRELR